MQMPPFTVAVRSLAVALVCLSAPRAVASPLEASIDYVGSGKVHVVEIGVLNTHTGEWKYEWAYAGELLWRWTSGRPEGAPEWFYAYCVDAANDAIRPQPVTIGVTDDLEMPGVPDAGRRAAWLFNHFAGSVRSSGGGADGAALQVAIWEVLYDAVPDLSSGVFQLLNSVDASVPGKAQAYIAALFSSDYTSATTMWLDSQWGEGQDQITSPVPEPASLLLTGFALAMLASGRRRRYVRAGAPREGLL